MRTFIVNARIKGKQKALIVRRLLRGLPVGRQVRFGDDSAAFTKNS